MSFIELRQYLVKEGQMDNWIKFFEEEMVPYQLSLGVAIHNSFRGEGDDSIFIWIRSFESEEARVAQYASLYGSDEWATIYGPRCQQYLDYGENDSNIKCTRIVSTARSPALPLLK